MWQLCLSNIGDSWFNFNSCIGTHLILDQKNCLKSAALLDRHFVNSKNLLGELTSDVVEEIDEVKKEVKQVTK